MSALPDFYKHVVASQAELLEVIAVLVDAMRRSDPLWCRVQGEVPCSDEDWEMAIEAGENALEAAGCS